MDIVICKKFVAIYDSINKKLDTLERVLCQDNGSYRKGIVSR